MSSSPKHLLALAAYLMLIPSCSESRGSTSDIPKLLEAIECEPRSIVGNIQRVADTEAKDQKNYKPISSEVLPIIMREPAKGYHGPTKGSYILILERYATDQEAKHRAEEYMSAGWAERLTPADDLELLYKSSVRCWAIPDGKDVYLLTTHAEIFSALEALDKGIRTKITKYLDEKRTQN